MFWDHGSSFTFGSDDSAPFSGSMDVDEIADQFRNDPEDETSGYETVDLVGFDACLMSSVEALSEFTEVAPLFVASAELEPGDGWNYQGLFDFMGGKADLTPTDLATAIVDRLRRLLRPEPGSRGWSASDTGRLVHRNGRGGSCHRSARHGLRGLPAATRRATTT